MFENVFSEDNISLTTKQRLFIEQNAYVRAQEYHNKLKKSNQKRERELRQKNSEIVKKKQDLILMKGTLPLSVDMKEIREKNQKIQSENENISNLIINIKTQIKQYKDIYNKLNSDFQNQLLSFTKLEQISLDHSSTAEQLKNIHLKAINKYEKVFQAENDLIHLLFSLQEREKIVSKKEKKLDLILSDPLDNIELDEFLTKSIEEYVSDLETKDQVDDSKLIKEIEKELYELENIFKNNKRRKKELLVLKNYIFSQSQMSSSSFMNNTSRDMEADKNDFVILHQDDKAQINMKIDNIIHNLNEKNRKCLNNSLEADQISFTTFQKNKELEKQFQIKKLKIQNLKDQISFTKDLNLSIKNEQNNILSLTKKLSSLMEDKERIKHSNSNASQSRKLFESKKEDLKRLRSLLNIRMKELKEKESRINKRKFQYQKDQDYISSQEIEIEQFEQKVQYLEEQTKVYEEKIKENCAEFNESYSVIYDEQSKLSYKYSNPF